eukprot:1509210-Amphidinium_carterae.1
MARTPLAGDVVLYTACSSNYQPQGQVLARVNRLLYVSLTHLIAFDYEWWCQQVGLRGGMPKDQVNHCCAAPLTRAGKLDRVSLESRI